MGKRIFAAVLALVIMSGCAPTSSVPPETSDAPQAEEQSAPAPEVSEWELKEEAAAQRRREYPSPDGRYCIVEELPDPEKIDENGYVGENVISCGGKVLWKKDVYAPGDIGGASDESLSKVQWRNAASAVINGELLYDAETGESVTFNENADTMLCYALDREGHRIAAAYLEDGVHYRLEVYNFADESRKTLFEGDCDRIYFFDAKIVWQETAMDQDIIFTTGVKTAEGVEPGALLDIWTVDADTGESRLLLKQAYLCCGTGDHADVELVFSRGERVGVYNLTKGYAVHTFGEAAVNPLWLAEKGVIAFYSMDNRALQLHSDQTYELLGSIDLSRIMAEEDIPSIEAQGDRLRIGVFDRAAEVGRYYTADISRAFDAIVREKKDTTYFFIEQLLLGAYEDGRFVSAEDRGFTYGEFFAQPWYDLYSQEGKLGRSREAECEDMPGLSNPINGRDAELLMKLAVKKEEGVNSFSLPLEMSYEEYCVRYGEYNGYIDFGDGLLAANAPHELLPRKVENAEVTARDRELVSRELAAEKMENAEAVVDKVYICDLEGDGTRERVIAASADWDDTVTAEKNSGNYVMLLIDRGDRVECVLKETARFTDEQVGKEALELFFENYLVGIDLLGVFDLNGDGVFEICISRHEWESAVYHALAADENGKYVSVMQRSCGT